MEILIIILLAIALLKPVFMLVMTVPTSVVHLVLNRKKSIRGRRFLCFFDDLMLHYVSLMSFRRVRMFYYRYVFHLDLGKNVVIYRGCQIRCPEKLSIGDGTRIGENAVLDARCGLSISDNVNLSSNVSIWTYQHDYRDPEFECNEEHMGPVAVGSRAWLGPNSIILHDVEIGEGAVVAAGAVVTKSVDPYDVVGGVPAKKIAERPRDMKYVFGKSQSHFQ